jgi:tRNA nucleotidyltransferase (CCA-adding enzyme)
MILPNTDDLLNSQLFQTIKKVVEKSRIETYLIGGFVRDIILNKKKPKDIDIVALGSGIKVAKLVQKELPGASKIKIFKTYGTAMFKWKGLVLEFVGARKESYSINSRNPIVEKGTLLNDQNRRDFTMNALAISLNFKDFGKILDPFNGFDDLKKVLLKLQWTLVKHLAMIL